MKLSPSLLILAGLAAACGVLAFAACGKKDSWSSPEEALEAGAQAAASQDYDEAIQAYTAASASGSASTRYAATLALGEAQVMSNRPDEAKATFQKVESDPQFSAQDAERITDAWRKAGQFEHAEAAVATAETRFPDSKATWDKLRQAIEATRTGDTSRLAELGYSDGEN